MLHIDEPAFAMHAVWELARAHGWHVFDHQEGAFIDLENLQFSPVDEQCQDDEEADDDEFSETVRRPELIELRYCRR